MKARYSSSLRSSRATARMRPPGGQLAVAEGLEQRRHQLAPGQVAGAAEEDEVEGHGRGQASPSAP
jgi:hypothetical protein